MKNNEIRAIRLSKDAVFEIVREFFMENGTNTFNSMNDNDIMYHFRECDNNGEYIIAMSKFDPAININDIDLKNVNIIDSVYDKVNYSVIKL
ncbi:MAG: hypothetical protein IKN38_08850 [Clostridia bacterium]|nr:hypothetical protein [Clostridia bacterium]